MSVIIPTYQRRELVKRAVASVLAQSYRDFELIVVDDGSTDGTREALARIDDRIRYEWQENRGVAAARNTGLRLARGSIVALLDSDNLWLPQHLHVVTELLRRHPEAVVATTCPGFVIRGRDELTEASIDDFHDHVYNASGKIGFISCVAARRAAISAAGGFDERLDAAEDSDLALRLAALGPFCMVRRRTVRRQYTAGGLRDRARESGAYLAATEITAQNLALAAEMLPDARRTQIEGEADGLLHLARALQAVAGGDDAVLRAELEKACRRLPLSERPRALDSRLRHHVPGFQDPDDRLRMVERVLRAWPDRYSPTERWLRAWGVGLAIRTRRPRTLVALLSGWRARGTLRFIRLITPTYYRRLRRRIQDRRAEVREIAALHPTSTGLTPTVSVIIPTYQRRELVRLAVASVLAQTYDDFELIVIDDGSTDGTGDGLAEVDDRLRYEWQENAGVAAARNAGLKLARGEIVAFLDSDDRWTDSHLGLIVKAMERHPDAVLAFTGRGSWLRQARRAKTRATQRTGRLLIGNDIGGPSRVAVRRDALLAVGGFDERLRVAEDADLWLRLALHDRWRFVAVPENTVLKGTSEDSLLRGRSRGEYAEALEQSTKRVIAELGQRPGQLAASRLARARGRAWLATALRALNEHDKEGVRSALAKACAALPALSERPGSVVNHLAYNLPEGSPPSEMTRQVERFARAWPDRGSQTARSLAVRASRDLLREGRFAGAWALRRRSAGDRVLRTGHRVALWTGGGPLGAVWRALYGTLARGVGAYLRLGQRDAAAYLRGSLATGDPIYGLSDIDLVIVVADDPDQPGAARRRAQRRWRRLRRRFPVLTGALLEPPKIYERDELTAELSSTTLTHGLERPGPIGSVRPSSRERRRERAGAERPGLYGPAEDWRLLAGRDLRSASRPPTVQENHAVAWMELQYLWLQAFRACCNPTAPWAAYACVKLIAEPARIWLWLDRRERLGGRAEVLERAMDLMPEERDVLRRALDLHATLRQSPRAPLNQFISPLIRISGRIADRLAMSAAEAGGTMVRLAWDGSVSAADPESAADISQLPGVNGSVRLLPLLDWRSLVWPPADQELLAPIGGDPSDPTLLTLAAEAGNNGVYAAIRTDGLLVLPSLKGARLRAVQCPLTDPVSFALSDRGTDAWFPELPGWSATDIARRAVAEHLGWLGTRGGNPDPEELGRLISAARAGLFLASLERGEPELALTAGAVLERIEVPNQPAIGALAAAVRRLPVYAG